MSDPLAAPDVMEILRRIEDRLERFETSSGTRAPDPALDHMPEWFDQVVNYDDLTGVANRSHLRRLLEQSLVNCAKGAPPGTLLFVGLERFQDINQTLGHALGDEVLRMIVRRMQDHVGERGDVARLSGAEFAILMPSLIDRDAAAVFAERLIDDLQTHPIKIDRMFEFDIAIAVGIVRFPVDAQGVSELIACGDLALARARIEPAGRVWFFERQQIDRAAQVKQIAMDLRRALEENELAVYYQAKVDLRTGEPTGMEALVRWRHPDRGVISPAAFLPVAEQTGLIAPISDWVTREACRQTAIWHKTGLPGLKVAVNLSSVQFRRQSVVASITAALEDADLDPSQLEVEITEGVLMGDSEVITETFRWLGAAGISLAVDDFGTGYSSLSYLTRFPLDVVKIDQSFVRAMEGDKSSATIVRAVIRLAHLLGMKVVAEGVENTAALMLLRDERCDLGQGWLFGKAVPADEFEAAVRGMLAG